MKSNRFNDLLNRYLNGDATREEREELMQLIQQGEHDDTIDESIDAMLIDGQVGEDMDPQQAKKIRDAILATGRSGKVVSMPAASGIGKWVASAAAVVMIALSIGWWLLPSEPVPGKLIAVEERKPGQPMVFSGKQFVHLPDGSTVLLNAGSRLSYSATFGAYDREVILMGEGYFDIQHVPSKPFKVLTGKITTTVLGTAFNIKAYPEEQEVKVTVSRGKVQISDDERTLAIITRDQEIAINTATANFVQREVKAETAQEWKSEYLILDDVTFEEAAEIIAGKYNIKITVAGDELKKCRISATFLDEESLNQVLMVVTTVVDATYEIRPDGNIHIEGDGCKET